MLGCTMRMLRVAYMEHLPQNPACQWSYVETRIMGPLLSLYVHTQKDQTTAKGADTTGSVRAPGF